MSEVYSFNKPQVPHVERSSVDFEKATLMNIW